MSDVSSSLIENPSDEQLDLELLQELDALQVEDATKELTRNPDFTAARFFQLQPQTYREIVRLRAENMSQKAISRLFKCSRNLVSAIDRRELGTESVEHIKREAKLSFQHLSKLTAERLRELLEDDDRAKKIGAKDMGILIGVLEDKAALLGGGVTSRVEITQGSHGHEDLTDYLDRLRADATRRMGLSGENPQQRAAQPGADPVANAKPIDVEVIDE